MSKEKRRVEARIIELEKSRDRMNLTLSQKRVEVANQEAELSVLRDEMNRYVFENTDEFKELEELKLARKWMNVYSGEEEQEETEEPEAPEPEPEQEPEEPEVDEGETEEPEDEIPETEEDDDKLNDEEEAEEEPEEGESEDEEESK